MIRGSQFYTINRLADNVSVIYMAEMDKRMQVICGRLDMLINDTSVPRNIRLGSDKAKNALMDARRALDVRAATAISMLDELANDQNIPMHARTLVWNIMSQLETLK